ncbi:MAG TPA: hypothetical protein VKU00_31105 [Chthonomonadaceae bacterium]|nr:hypothetical protein [Chthonomonadaceae bacterium]
MQRRDGERAQRLKRVWSRWCVLGWSVLLLLLPLALWAQRDEDEKPVPLDPQTKAMQLTAFTVVGALVVAVVIFYYVRRWQLMRSDKVQEGFERDED